MKRETAEPNLDVGASPDVEQYPELIDKTTARLVGGIVLMTGVVLPISTALAVNNTPHVKANLSNISTPTRVETVTYDTEKGIYPPVTVNIPASQPPAANAGK